MAKLVSSSKIYELLISRFSAKDFFYKYDFSHHMSPIEIDQKLIGSDLREGLAAFGKKNLPPDKILTELDSTDSVLVNHKIQEIKDSFISMSNALSLISKSNSPIAYFRFMTNPRCPVYSEFIQVFPYICGHKKPQFQVFSSNNSRQKIKQLILEKNESELINLIKSDIPFLDSLSEDFFRSIARKLIGIKSKLENPLEEEFSIYYSYLFLLKNGIYKLGKVKSIDFDRYVHDGQISFFYAQGSESITNPPAFSQATNIMFFSKTTYEKYLVHELQHLFDYLCNIGGAWNRTEFRSDSEFRAILAVTILFKDEYDLIISSQSLNKDSGSHATAKRRLIYEVENKTSIFSPIRRVVLKNLLNETYRCLCNLTFDEILQPYLEEHIKIPSIQSTGIK